MIKLVKLKQVHLNDFGGLPHGISRKSAFAALDIKNGSFTAMHEGKILAMGGVVPHRRGVGEAWFLVYHKVDINPSALFFTARQGFKKIQEHWRYHRVECNVRHDFYKGLRFARLLGFKKEVDKPFYGENGETYVSYVKIFPENLE